MSDPLTLARATPLGPYVPATEAVLRGWIGPLVCGASREVVVATHVADGCARVLTDDGVFTYTLASLGLDCRRPEVRWRLVDLGLLPVALRDHPGAAVAVGRAG